ncbi:IgGFc-binding protein-like [Varanus komodoensis]|nr:IgGFc-binding protein-like [Varanus komodoensis]
MLLSGTCVARSHGKEFVTAFLYNLRQSQPDPKFTLLINGYHPETNVLVTVNNPNFQKTVTVNEGQVVSIQLPSSLEMLDSGLFDGTVKIQANKDISVFSCNHKLYSSGSTVVYPVEQLGKLYYVVTPSGDLENTFKEFAVVAHNSPTLVDILLTGAVTFRGLSYPAGSRLVVDLKAFQAIQLQSSDDLSGTRVESVEPVAVLSGHSCARKHTACDHVVEQLLPVSSWGTTYIVPSLSYQSKFYITYVLASQNTSISYQSGLQKRTRNMVAGEVIQIATKSSQPLFISADERIQVLFFSGGTISGNLSYDQLIPLSADAPEGSQLYDPFLINIPALESYCRQYHIDGMGQNDNYIIIIAITSESSQIQLAKKPIENIQWQAIPGTEYSWAELSLGTKATVLPIEHLTSSFGVVTFGGSYRDGYGSVALCSCRSRPTSSVSIPKGSALVPPVPKSEELFLYSYGTDQGDMKNPKSDDAESPAVSVAVPFPFYGKKYSTLYVDNNGLISLGETVPVTSLTPDSLPRDGGPPLIAPFWSDINTRAGGNVFWRQTQNPKLLDRCTTDINEYFPDIPFTATWAFIATWDRVAYFGSRSKKVNTFQAVLTTDGEKSFAIFNYASIQWTTGTVSGGHPKTGLGGTPAQAGFDNGDKINYYIIPGSRTPDILHLAEASNVNSPGHWVYRVDQHVAGVSTDCVV